MTGLRVRLLLTILLAGSGCSADPAAATPGAAAGRRWEARLSGVPQRHSLSCEARSACDLLAAHGLAATEEAFLACLPRSDNPDHGFVGDPDEPGGRLPPHGYGVHAGPVVACLRRFGLAATEVHGVDLDWLAAELDAGRCVIVWATTDLRARPSVTGTDARGRPYRAVAGEHTFLAVGRHRGRVHLLDPSTGEVRRVSEEEFDGAWASLGRMAVRAEGPATPGASR